MLRYRDREKRDAIYRIGPITQTGVDFHYRERQGLIMYQEWLGTGPKPCAEAKVNLRLNVRSCPLL